MLVVSGTTLGDNRNLPSQCHNTAGNSFPRRLHNLPVIRTHPDASEIKQGAGATSNKHFEKVIVATVGWNTGAMLKDESDATDTPPLAQAICKPAGAGMREAAHLESLAQDIKQKTCHIVPLQVQLQAQKRARAHMLVEWTMGGGVQVNGGRVPGKIGIDAPESRGTDHGRPCLLVPTMVFS
ncbi:hypothetical protein FOMPIDRAFT_114905 [Fomitopsis schrenkii]|uniref:Uncharacterized protein n=1 Tax=Fomitopsis schrenkii TaxID=2126942 RepID=S8DLP7_FOMSC|nr:hypothetical protein FOMPIDRAFT_114905 [Fomitopsis schrenkii]